MVDQSSSKKPQVVLVLGKTGVGKSTFIKAATGLDVKIGNALDTCKYWSREHGYGQTLTAVRHTRSADIPRPGLDDLPDRYAGL